MLYNNSFYLIGKRLLLFQRLMRRTWQILNSHFTFPIQAPQHSNIMLISPWYT